MAAIPVILVVLAAGLQAQATPGRLAGYVGTYADAPGHTLEIVAGDGLFAVVDEAQYPLRPAGKDQFSTTITTEAAALARPRPQGQDAPADYH